MRKWMLSVFVAAAIAAPAVVVAEDKPIIAPEEGLPIVNWTDAGKYVGKQVIVQGKIVATGRARTITFLNFDQARSFVAIVRKRNYERFEKTPDFLYADKLVQIRGRITTYKNKPQIEVHSPDQVTIVEKLAPTADGGKAPAKRDFNGVVRLATYNVLNLFDAEDDPYCDDEGTNPKPREQLEKLAETIRNVNADVLALQEVENRRYLERFNTAFLGDLGYEHVVLFEGNDGRGIDVAVLSRLPVGPVTSYRHMRWKNDRGLYVGFRRDLLRVRIEPPGADPFDVFTVHLKSKGGGPNETESIRIGEVKAIRKVVDSILAADSQAKFVVCGDFNDTWDSKPIKIMRGDGATVLPAFVDDVGVSTPTFNREPHRSMIDYVFCSPAMAKRYVAKSMSVMEGSVGSSGSDHNPVVLEFNLGRPAATASVSVSGG